MISISNISKAFKLYKSPADRLKEIMFRRCCHRKFQALKDVSFDVKKGETLGIVGSNGAGKSTILKILTGILIHDTGTVNLSGKITGLLELGTGFNAEFSGIDNIYLNGTYLGLSRREIEQRLDRIIEFTELNDFIHEPVKTYSSGMLMRLGFSVAIHADPKAFVVDEALAVGDAYFQQKCINKIREFKQNGGSIVFVSHDMNAVKVLCDQAILLEEGQIYEKGTPVDVINTYNFLIAKKSKGEEIKHIVIDKSSGYGNKRVTINDVRLQDKTGDSVRLLVSGTPALLKINLTAHETIKDLTVGILIRDKYGQDIFGTNSFHLKKELPAEKGKSYNLSFQFAEFNIGPGKYTLTVAAHTQDSHIDECFHWIDGSTTFEVVTGNEFYFAGLSRLTPELVVEDG